MTAFPPPLPSAAINALALELYRLAMAVTPDGHPDAQPGQWDRNWDLRTRYVLAARAMLRNVADHALILPRPAKVSVEYAVWWHGGDPAAIRLDERQFSSRERAARRAEERIGEYGIVGYRIVSREHHLYEIEDGSGLDSITTDWVESPQPTPTAEGGTPTP